MNRIYLISDTGAAYGMGEGAARALEAKAYHRCSRKEYHRKKRQMRQADTAEDDFGSLTRSLRKR